MIIILGKGASRSGSGQGVRDYYLHGTNGDRNKKDKRVVLSGDLNTLSHTIDLAHQMNYKETYRNIVLSFNEDYIKHETLLSIVNDFKRQYLAGYDEEEYVFYAEAHLPKLKIKKDPVTGKITHRKPHIHMTIPIYSPKLDKALSLGNHRQRLKELETWKTVIEKKYGLKPAQNASIKTDITQLHDTKLQRRQMILDICRQVITENLYKKILDRHSLKMVLLDNVKDIEDIRESTHKAKTAYFSIKFKDIDKPIRIKGDLFSVDHLKFREARETLLNQRLDSKYYEAALPRVVPITLQNRLDSYYNNRCAYISTREVKARTREKNAVYDNTQETKLCVNDAPLVSSQKSRPLTSVIQTMIQDIQDDIDTKNINEHYKKYKKTLTPQYVFTLLRINKDKYAVSMTNNEYRITCGKRHLNIHDFLTKEMNLSWHEAKKMMDKAYQQQSLIESQKMIKRNNVFVCYQDKIFYSVYKVKLEHDLQNYYVKVVNDIVYITSKTQDIDIVDYGDVIEAKGKNIKEQVKLMLDIATAKGWDLSQIEVNGSQEFKEESFKQIEARLKEDGVLENLDKLHNAIKVLNKKLGFQANSKQTNDGAENNIPIIDEALKCSDKKNRNYRK